MLDRPSHNRAGHGFGVGRLVAQTTYAATSRIRCGDNTPLKDIMSSLPTVTCLITFRYVGLTRSRSGPKLLVEPAALREWHWKHPAAMKTLAPRALFPAVEAASARVARLLRQGRSRRPQRSPWRHARGPRVFPSFRSPFRWWSEDVTARSNRSGALRPRQPDDRSVFHICPSSPWIADFSFPGRRACAGWHHRMRRNVFGLKRGVLDREFIVQE
jgi:hypothetical protein